MLCLRCLTGTASLAGARLLGENKIGSPFLQPKQTQPLFGSHLWKVMLVAVFCWKRNWNTITATDSFGKKLATKGSNTKLQHTASTRTSSPDPLMSLRFANWE